MADGDEGRTAFTLAEAEEIRRLLDGLPEARRAVRRTSMARLRRMELGIAARPEMRPTRARFEDLVSLGALRIDEADGTEGRRIQPHPSGKVFRVAVGVTGDSVPADWNAFEERYQWLGKSPQSVTSGAHLFVLAVDRWRSAVVGLYEAVSPGAAKLPNSPDPERWPWALGVRPLAAIPPPEAVRVEGQRGPQGGLPEFIADADARDQLYRAVAASPPPPGPQTLEQRVQELQWLDVVPDVLEAVRSLGKEARRQAVVSRAIEIGEWSEEELEARAWYTGSGVASHVEHIVTQALELEVGSKGRLERVHGVYSVRDAAAPGAGFAAPYRPAGDDEPDAEQLSPNLVDLSELDRATRRHMDLQDRLAAALREREVEPDSPQPWQPRFDLGFEHEGRRFVVEVKGGDPVTPQQIRLAVGQVLEYRRLLSESESAEFTPVILVESTPPHPWPVLAADLGISLLRADELDGSLSALLASTAG
jgi:hypothetical protein